MTQPALFALDPEPALDALARTDPYWAGDRAHAAGLPDCPPVDVPRREVSRWLLGWRIAAEIARLRALEAEETEAA